MEKVGDLNKRGKRISCDVDGVRDQGGLARGGSESIFSEEKGPKFAIFRLRRAFIMSLCFYLTTIVRRRRKFSFSHRIFPGGDFLKECDPYTPDTEIECDKKMPGSRKKCDGWGVDGVGVGREQFEPHITNLCSRDMSLFFGVYIYYMVL